MLSKLLSRAKQEKKEAVEKKDNPNDEPTSGVNISELEKLYLNERNLKINDLSHYKVSSIDTIYYIPNYISKEDEAFLLHQINLQPKERWSQLKYANRRLQKWGGEVTASGLKNFEDLPDWLEKFSDLLCKENITSQKTNHVLLNEYPPGVGIMPHTDGPLYFPYVVILSLESHACFDFYADYAAYKNETSLAKLLIEPRSLLIFTEDAYAKYLHSIGDTEIDFIDLEYSVDKSGEKLNVNTSNIENLHLTNLFNDFKSQVLSQKDVENEGKMQAQTWRLKREKRISLTIRFVPRHS